MGGIISTQMLMRWAKEEVPRAAGDLAGLTPAELEALGKRMFDLKEELPTDEQGNVEECVICFEEFCFFSVEKQMLYKKTSEDIRELHKHKDVQHRFHAKCIDKWLSEHTTCPSCQEDVKEEANELI